MPATIAIFTMGMFLLAYPEGFGLPVFMDMNRTQMFFGIALGGALGLPFALPDAFSGFTVSEKLRAKYPKYIVAVAAFLCFVSVLVKMPGSPPGATFEYDQAAEAYYKIRNTFPPLDWTIISPTEQYGQVLGRGWHTEIAEFLRDNPLDSVSNPAYDPKIPTTYVFIYVERINFITGKPFDPKLA